MTKPLRQLWALCVEVLVGGIMFGLIAALGAAIFLLTGWMQKIGMPEPLTKALTAVQFLVVIANVFNYLWFIVVVSFRFLKQAGEDK